MTLLDVATPTYDLTHGNRPVATIQVDAFTLAVLVHCTRSTTQNPRISETLTRVLAHGETPIATDAGQICHECGCVVTWVDHLPPLEEDGPVRCFSKDVDG